MSPVVGCIRGALVGLVLLAASCSGTSTPEDARRADILNRDPLFTTAIEGVRWGKSSHAEPGSGPGPEAYDTEASRHGTTEGDPRRVMLEAAKTARQLSWIVTDALCDYTGRLIVSGWKQFDRFVAYVSIAWDRYSQFSVSADTPPVHGGRPTNTPLGPSAEMDLTKSCLVTGEDTGEHDQASVFGWLTYVGGPGAAVSNQFQPGKVLVYTKAGEQVAHASFAREVAFVFAIPLKPGTYRLVSSSGHADCPELTVHVPTDHIVDVHIKCSVK